MCPVYRPAAVSHSPSFPTRRSSDLINVVDLDHYLLKPWDPPEQNLYPVLDEQLRAWAVSDRQPPQRVRVVGHRWSPDRKSTRLNSSHVEISYAVFCLKKKKVNTGQP